MKEIEEIIESSDCNPSDLLTSEGSKTNAIKSINFLSEVGRFCLVFQLYPKVSTPQFLPAAQRHGHKGGGVWDVVVGTFRSFVLGDSWPQGLPASRTPPSENLLPAAWG